MHRRFRWLATGVAVIAIAASALATAAVAVTGSAATYTGCLSVKGGTLTLINQGQSPQKPCPPGSVVARFSEGDITSITAGTGLVGGGESGDVSVSLAPAYRLPQGCATGKIAQWSGTAWACADDANTTYTAGDGLTLTGTEFSLDDANRLPSCGLGEAVTWTRTQTSLGEWGCRTFAGADQSCSAGKVVTAVDEDGALVCATPAAGTASDVNYVSTSSDGGGVPDDGVNHVFASLTPGAGTYFIVAKGTLKSGGNVDDFSAVGCELRVDGAVVDEFRFGSAVTDNVTEIPFALTAGAPSTTSISLECYADSGADAISVEDLKLVALKF